MNILKLNAIAISTFAALFSFEVAQAANAVPVINEVSTAKVAPVARRVTAQAPSVKRSILFSVGKAKPSVSDVSNTLAGIGYDNTSVDDAGNSNTYAIGFRQPIGRHWTIDATYVDQGDVSASIEATPVSGNTSAQTAEDAALSMPIYGSGISYIALRHIPVLKGITAQAGVGAFLWTNERDATIDSVKHVEKDRGINLVAQLGLSFAIARKLSVEVSGQRFFMSGDDVDRLSVGVAVSF